METTKGFNPLRILTPLIFAAIFMLFGIIESYLDMAKSVGWSYIGILIGFPVIGALLLLHLAIKLMCGERLAKRWLVELGVLLLLWIIAKQVLML